MTETEKVKKTWRRGRWSICGKESSATRSFNICPDVLATMHNYCIEKKILKSILVNEAIRAYIENNQ